MSDIIIMVLAGLGALFILLAAIGIVRMPDLYLRISVTTKAATLGIGLILACCALHFGSVAITSRVVAIIFFMILTAPVGAHLIGRASYFIGVPMWKKSVMDDLKGRYEADTHELKGEEE
ncbi:MAG: monovalent cation/H(+) antiporter subunit G [Saprospiraceae bacterium]|nr:monovalent cation/H(+) antiporter subunit G [Saprospiraceae bacterium]